MSNKQRFSGLTDHQVTESRRKYGENILTPPRKKSLWSLFMRKFRDPLIIILLVAGVLSVGIACYEHFYLDLGVEVFFEPVGIYVAILLATGLAFYFEHQAEKEFAVLNRVNDAEHVSVVRNGNVVQVERREVVVGDIVLLVTGEEVPADGKLVEAIHLRVDESTLTGEPICDKTTDETAFDPDATYPSDTVLKGTKVMEGYGTFCVTAVGDCTEQGKVYDSVRIDNSVRTPFNEQLDKLGAWISVSSYVIAFLIVVFRIISYFVQNGTECMDTIEELTPFVAYVLQTLMIAVTLVVVAVPEGLPMAITLSLAYSMRRMLKTNNLVRKLHACETMGAATVICTDKTGTLTMNQMVVNEMKIYDDSLPAGLFNEMLALNSTASLDFSDSCRPRVLGNPTEGALLLWLNSRGADYRMLRSTTKVVDVLPFSTERKYMATIVESDALGGKRVLYVKGAPEIVYAMCRKSAVDRVTVDKQLLSYQNRAMRTLGFAYQVLGDGDSEVLQNDVVTAPALCFVGVAAIADPVRPDVPEAIKKCRDAGIEVKIVTGDTPVTAREIARQIGLWSDNDGDAQIITGPEFASLSDEQLLDRVLDLKIIARARPLDKKRLVEALQRRNQVVAVTGDGTNDAPALKVAHVGLSMGDGTSVAKEASDITIIDNSFSSIAKAVMWGRSLYKNIQRFILFQLTVNVTACLLVLSGAFMGTESPLTVTQMLWINLIMDTFAAMALASLPPSERVMGERPRDRHAFILTRSMLVNIFGVGGFFFVLLVALLYVFQHADIHRVSELFQLSMGAKSHVTTYELTVLFSVFVMTHFFYLFNARAFDTGRSALHFKGCKGLLIIVAVIMVGQLVIVEVPGMQLFFNVCGLSCQDWLIIIAASSLVLWGREFYNLLKPKPAARL